jgi:hypothetical protein
VRCPQAPQAKQQQKKRTFDVLQNADSFTRYGQRSVDFDQRIAAGKLRSGGTAMMSSISSTPRVPVQAACICNSATA